MVRSLACALASEVGAVAMGIFRPASAVLVGFDPESRVRFPASEKLGAVLGSLAKLPIG